MTFLVEITSCSSDSSKAIGYAEGKLDDKEFTASWATFSPLGALFYDTWFDTTSPENEAIAKALNKLDVMPPVHTWQSNSN